MKLDALTHPKTNDLAARLKVSRPTAIGHLELLWAFTGIHSAQGNVGKWPNGAIARACDWMDDPDVFIQALVDSKFVDLDPDFRLTVHDWSHHAPGWVRAKLKKVGLSFIASSEHSSEPSNDGSSEASKVESEASSEPSSRAPVPSVEKSSVEKSSERKSARAPAAPRGGGAKDSKPKFDAKTVPGLDLGAWSAWVQYRAERKPAIKPFSMQAAAEELASFGDQQAAVVRHSKANQYQGLIAPKINGSNGVHGPPLTKFDRVMQHLAIPTNSDGEPIDEQGNTINF